MDVLDRILELLRAGGWVMWPLLGLSVLSLAITLERAAFWLRCSAATRRLDGLITAIRAGDRDKLAKRLSRGRSVYDRFLSHLLVSAPTPTESHAFEAAEALRPTIERFAVTMSTIITAAPMLGILGTVTGIIQSFDLLNAAAAARDPATVAGGIGEALFTTAFGLIVALVTLFPHAVFRANADRCLSRLELLAAVMRDAAEPGTSAKR